MLGFPGRDWVETVRHSVCERETVCVGDDEREAKNERTCMRVDTSMQPKHTTTDTAAAAPPPPRHHRSCQCTFCLVLLASPAH